MSGIFFVPGDEKKEDLDYGRRFYTSRKLSRVQLNGGGYSFGVGSSQLLLPSVALPHCLSIV